MPLVKIGPKRQVTIPKEVIASLQLAIGDVLEMRAENGKGILILKRVVARKPRPRPTLTTREKILLASAKKKIAAINRDIRKAKGLTDAETKVAAKAGLIDPDQRWWWTEEWQKGERRAQRDIDEGRVSKTYDNVDEALRELKGAI
ncbi:AbrB/MazE/SpoVT family DNA-binding domain-containing protein [candidate division KSB1 bacterium]|nr:AbrB/MazE/SpoVT family DNA-binding domain-containing protein [candidate division KSB1 bacterium]